MKIVMMIETSGLQYDDRLRKESLTLAEKGAQVRIVALEQANEAERRTVYEGIPAATITLKSRSWFPQRKGLAVKLLETYLRFVFQALRAHPDVLWVHNLTFAALLPLLFLLRRLGVISSVVWDQHELPPDSVLERPWTRRILVWLMNRCQVVIVASKDRQLLLQEQLAPHLRVPLVPLENYPDNRFAKLPIRNLFQSIVDWLNGDPYFLVQGGVKPGRHLDELVQAVIEMAGVKLLLAGPFQEDKVFEFRQRYGAVIAEKVWFTGYIPQMDMTQYIDAAVASVVFYEMRNLNWRYCAPNRSFQALSRGVPLVVSENPPLRRIVDQYNCGIAVDATSVTSIRAGLAVVLRDQSHYRRRTRELRNTFIWESQSSRFATILDRIHFYIMSA